MTTRKDALDALAVKHRSEEHTSELQSQSNLVCRLLLEKKNKPVMSAAGIADTVMKAVDAGPLDVGIVNFAYAAVVEHYGIGEPSVRGGALLRACLRWSR